MSWPFWLLSMKYSDLKNWSGYHSTYTPTKESSFIIVVNYYLNYYYYLSMHKSSKHLACKQFWSSHWILCLCSKLILCYRLIPSINFNYHDICLDNIRIFNTIRWTNNGFSNICNISFRILCDKRHSIEWIHKDIPPNIDELELCDIGKLVFNCIRCDSSRINCLYWNLLRSNR